MAIPSLSIGAVSVNSGVVLAGTGDPNDASDSYYGEGMLRSADGGVTWTLIQKSNDGVAGNHSFTGLSVAGFAWSSSTPGLVVAAVSEAAEGMLVNGVGCDEQRDGTLLLDGRGRDVADGGDQGWQPGGADSAAVRREPGGNAATAVVWNPVRQRFYAAVRYHGYYRVGGWGDVDAAGTSAWDRDDGDGLSYQPGAAGKCGLPDLSRGVGGAGGYRRYVCVDCG